MIKQKNYQFALLQIKVVEKLYKIILKKIKLLILILLLLYYFDYIQNNINS